MALSDQEISSALSSGFAALQAGDVKTAEICCQRVLAARPQLAQGHFLVGLIALETGKRRIAAAAFNTVATLEPKNAAAHAHLAKIFAELGLTVQADDALARAEAERIDNAVIANVIGAVNASIGEHEKAANWYQRALTLEPGNSAYEINLANMQNFLGQSAAAEATVRGVLKHQPGNPQAHWILSGVVKATDDGHAREMVRYAEAAQGAHAKAFLYFGAGKAFEDIADWKTAFDCFSKGAKARRTTIEFDEYEEEKVFSALENLLTREWLNADRSETETDSPIFIIGQPRTGTTLVERIITSHSKVASAGELQQFYLSIRRLSRAQTPNRVSAALIDAASAIKPTSLGEAYARATAPHAARAPRFVDKMPVNYLYAPLIARALPNARIVHITRGAMDSCFSSYKQLFADAYPHSYDLEEMARHHVRYRRLMERWRDVLGDRMLDVSYEETVRDVEGAARRIIEYLGLDWEAACAAFHEQKGAVATASAAQVREPAHTRSIGRWRCYEKELEPAARIIAAAGFDLD